jgi:PTS system nitrogen regulatory IIA component
MVKISKFLDSKQVVFTDAKKRDLVIHQLVDVMSHSGRLKDAQGFFKAIIDREKIVTTGIGMGVAIPHAKQHEFNDFFIVVGVLREGVDWSSLDGTPVRLVFLIGGPDDKQTEYLQILSALTLAIKDEERRKKIVNAGSAEEVIKLFKGF